MMDFDEIRDFFESIDNHTEQEVLSIMQYIKEYICTYKYWELTKECMQKLFRVADRKKVLYELFKDEEKFIQWNKKLDIPEELKFGLEIEVDELPYDEIETIFKSDEIHNIMSILGIPTEIANGIIDNCDYKKKNQYDKWIFSCEAYNQAEVSTPIMQNNLEYLNKVGAICIIFRALRATLNGATGLHINIGANYFECNEKAIENLLKLWGECEELFFKMANPEGEEIRVVAHNMATPIKENIQNFFENDGSVTIKTEEDMEMFLYQIQAKNRMDDIVAWSNDGLEFDLFKARTDKDRFKVYHIYEEINRKKENPNSKVRWTSINFNHMKWNDEEPGRIEIRIFNSSLEPKIIFEDLLLVGKLFEVSLENARNPKYKEQEFVNLFSHKVSESEKVNNLLNLLFDKEEQKQIFRRRWKSVKDNNTYNNYISGRDTFERE